MTKFVTKQLAAIAVSTVMATSAVGLARLAPNSANSGMAFANTAHYAMTDDAAIGVGVEATNVEITNKAPAVLTINNVAAGSYILSVSIVKEKTETSYVITAKVDNGASVDLIFNWFEWAYVGTVKVPAGATSLTLSVKSNIEGEEDAPVELTANAVLKNIEMEDGVTLYGVAVESNAPAMIDISKVTPGTYILGVITEVVKGITDSDGEEVIEPTDLYASIDGVGTKLTYSPNSGAYSAVVTIGEDAKTLAIASLNSNSYVVDVRFSEYALTPANGYYLGGVVVTKEKPAEIPLTVDAEGDYMVAVDLGDEQLPEGVTITAKVNNGAEATLNKDDNYYSTYVGTLHIDTEATKLTISTTASELTVTVSLVKQTPVYQLVNDNVETLRLYDTVNYSYTVAEDGYYVISATNVSEPMAGYDIFLKTDVDTFDGITIHGNNFPTYLYAGTYYYQITYTGIEIPQDWEDQGEPVITPDAVTVKFNVHDWEKTPIIKDVYTYVPATTSFDEVVVNMTLDGIKTGERFGLSLIDIPMSFMFSGSSIIAHYAGREYVFNAANGYYNEILATGVNTIYFTTDFYQQTTIGVAITDGQYLMVENQIDQVALSATNNKVDYTIQLTAGTYYIELALPAGEAVQVLVDGEVVIESGENVGVFVLNLPEEEYMGQPIITFVYNGTKDIIFDVVVTPNILVLDDDNEVTIDEYVFSKTYFIVLPEGTYDIVLDLPAGVSIQVTINGDIKIAFGEDEADFTISATQAGIVKIAFETSGFEKVTFGATITEN